ncbi:MAG: hypothetical protein KGJ90_07385, partial [Patescibacteria group bacterium]|nr:hypothetical protein [Patescibacteria group bacterium]
MPAKRAPKEFEKIFKNRFSVEFPQGLFIKDNGKKLRSSYRSASSSFEIELDLNDLPDVIDTCINNVLYYGVEVAYETIRNPNDIGTKTFASNLSS